MFIVTRDGHKLPVDVSSLEDEEYVDLNNPVGVYHEDSRLKPVWVVSLEHYNPLFQRREEFELEFDRELLYDHKPSKEEILWALARYGHKYGSIAFVRKGWTVERECED